MSVIATYWTRATTFLATQLQGASFFDIVDIVAVAVILYYVMKFLRDRRAAKLVLGLCLMLALWLVSYLLDLVALEFILAHVFQIGLIALAIIFQPELRSVLEQVGGSSLRGIRAISEISDEAGRTNAINSICEAVVEMAKEKTGALIVIERTTRLGDIIHSGTILDANMSALILRNIFFNKAPLHDGAVVIRNERIYAAGCFLPLSQNQEIIQDLGTRHRAAIGMSENSDAAVIVVSEETGTISVAQDGRLRRNFDYVLLRRELERLLPNDEKNSRRPWSRFFARFSKKGKGREGRS